MDNQPKDYKDLNFEEVLEDKWMDFFIEIFHSNKNISLKSILLTLEKAILQRSLQIFNGSQKQTSEYLGIKQTTLFEKLKRYQIDPKDFQISPNDLFFFRN